MRHAIDPKIDCVFKALLGAEPNRDLLVHFLNAMLGDELPAPIVDVVILNPYNEREFLDDKLSIVDVKARDAAGCLYQIEMQRPVRRSLRPKRPRSAVLRNPVVGAGEPRAKGQGPRRAPLGPRPSALLLPSGSWARPCCPTCPATPTATASATPKAARCSTTAALRCSSCPSSPPSRQPPSSRRPGRWQVASEEERWLKLFVEGEYLDPDNLPPWMNTPEMRRVMSTMQGFSEKERAYHAYQARQNYLRQQKTIQRRIDQLTAAIEREQAEKARARGDLERERAEKDQARAAEQRERAEKERERTEKEAALAEIERLKARLKGRQDLMTLFIDCGAAGGRAGAGGERRRAVAQAVRRGRVPGPRQPAALTAAIEREQAEKARARGDLERERAEKDQARAAEQRERAEKERERTEKEAALAEIERLEARLKGAADD
jgi:hypothetical protein